MLSGLPTLLTNFNAVTILSTGFEIDTVLRLTVHPVNLAYRYIRLIIKKITAKFLEDVCADFIKRRKFT